ncbi:MAG: Gfo/Idh/MocA family oxidoreductase [Verrucomicrobia bacterium]|nr:Gfo/Idh/MocA family oxidoreductase [Verrucomicrobiota bacterium]
MKLGRTLKMGMVGGGPGAFIGEVHRKAVGLIGQIELVGGAFDIDPAQSKQLGKELNLNPSRVYENYGELIKKELQLPVGERMDFVTICVPNNWHFLIAKDLLEADFHVLCEKPMTLTTQEARDLVNVVEKTERIFGLMHNYTGYPMVKLAKDMVSNGDLGEIRKVVVRYSQDWLATALEKTGQKQAAWRADPKQGGASGCGGDIGTHAVNLAEYISGLKMTHLCAELTAFVEGRQLADDANCLIKYDNGARGVLHVSQIAAGEGNNLAIWIYGEKGGIEWHQEEPNTLQLKPLGGPVQVWMRGNDYVAAYSDAAGRATHLPAGHPEGFYEAMATIYLNFSDTVRAQIMSAKADPIMLDFPNVEDGLRGMLFIETLLASAESEQKWTPFKN